MHGDLIGCRYAPSVHAASLYGKYALPSVRRHLTALFIGCLIPGNDAAIVADARLHVVGVANPEGSLSSRLHLSHYHAYGSA